RVVPAHEGIVLGDAVGRARVDVDADDLTQVRLQVLAVADLGSVPDGDVVGPSAVPDGDVQVAVVGAEQDFAAVVVELGLVPVVDDALGGKLRLVRVRLGNLELRKVVGAAVQEPRPPRCVGAHGGGVHDVKLPVVLELGVKSHAQQPAL